MHRLIIGFFCFVLLIVFAQFALYGYAAYKAIQTIEQDCQGNFLVCLGKGIKEIKKGME